MEIPSQMVELLNALRQVLLGSEAASESAREVDAGTFNDARASCDVHERLRLVEERIRAADRLIASAGTTGNALQLASAEIHPSGEMHACKERLCEIRMLQLAIAGSISVLRLLLYFCAGNRLARESP